MGVPASPVLNPLPPPSPLHPSGSSQCTGPEHPVSLSLNLLKPDSGRSLPPPSCWGESQPQASSLPPRHSAELHRRPRVSHSIKAPELTVVTSRMTVLSQPVTSLHAWTSCGSVSPFRKRKQGREAQDPALLPEGLWGSGLLTPSQLGGSPLLTLRKIDRNQWPVLPEGKP